MFTSHIGEMDQEAERELETLSDFDARTRLGEVGGAFGVTAEQAQNLPINVVRGLLRKYLLASPPEALKGPGL
ncbi:hypothetical protein AYJ54_24345 [Bradyrhizobium centrolobii]|uniref:Uncharacterized protein n=2 Tax=Bradyrhizobium TaxID=374 RepID=A0A176Z7D9_9BRAD|nr:hypothetical protein AYJ54_24345 [Bradyrhizobium centrolobii]OAF16609.1 hypothetical protein AXW67_12195 [Bradyrhizobium neotropicale]